MGCSPVSTSGADQTSLARSRVSLTKVRVLRRRQIFGRYVSERTTFLGLRLTMYGGEDSAAGEDARRQQRSRSEEVCGPGCKHTCMKVTVTAAGSLRLPPQHSLTVKVAAPFDDARQDPSSVFERRDTLLAAGAKRVF